MASYYDFWLPNRQILRSAALAAKQPQQTDACQGEGDAAGFGDNVTRRIRTAEENLLSAIVQVTHANIEQHHVAVVEAVRIDAGENGVVGKARSLTVDR